MNSLRSNSVTQSNQLVQAHYSLKLNEKRLLVAAISQIDPTSKAWTSGGVTVSVTAQQWTDLFGVSPKDAYGELRKASRELFGRSVRLFGDHINGKNIRWISAEEYSQNEGRVAITFTGDVLYHLSGMIDEFTSYDLLGVSGLKSAYAVRLYELLMQFKKTGWRVMGLSDFRDAVGCTAAYPKFSDFRRRVIEKAVSELNRKSDIEVSWEPLKRGRTIYAIRLDFSEKQQLDMFASDCQQHDEIYGRVCEEPLADRR